MKQTKKNIRKLYNTALKGLYILEDWTNYENKNISKAINLLQKVNLKDIPIQKLSKKI